MCPSVARRSTTLPCLAPRTSASAAINRVDRVGPDPIDHNGAKAIDEAQMTIVDGNGPTAAHRKHSWASLDKMSKSARRAVK